jgi:hypothetical protein
MNVDHRILNILEGNEDKFNLFFFNFTYTYVFTFTIIVQQ